MHARARRCDGRISYPRGAALNAFGRGNSGASLPRFVVAVYPGSGSGRHRNNLRLVQGSGELSCRELPPTLLLRVVDALGTSTRRRATMASSSRKKTTMAKLNREAAVRERRARKKAKKDARNEETVSPPAPFSDTPEIVEHPDFLEDAPVSTSSSA
jgi:hypothetical protein